MTKPPKNKTKIRHLYFFTRFFKKSFTLCWKWWYYIKVYNGVGCACAREGIDQDEEQDLAPQLSGGGCGLGSTGSDRLRCKNELYTPAAFAGGSAARKVLEYCMGDQASADRDTVLERIAAGQSAEAAMAEFLTDDYFEAWYQATLAQLQQYEG